jgi:4-hydroxy-4-methyl-2-oxoglutarate aldolase
MRTREDDALVMARLGTVEVHAGDVVLADDDAVLFLAQDELGEVLNVARHIAGTERAQAARMRRGESLRTQLRWADYTRAREASPTLTFREHLRRVGGAIEQ